MVIFDGNTGKRLSKIVLNIDFVDHCFTPEGTLLTLDSISLREWQPADGKLLKHYNTGFDVTDLRISSDGRSVMVLAYSHQFRSWVCPDRQAKDQIFEKKTRLVGFASGGRMVEVPLAGAGYAKILSPDGSTERKFSIANDSVLDILGIPDTVVISPGGDTLAIGGNRGVKFYPLNTK